MITRFAIPAMFAGFLALISGACSNAPELTNREIFSRSCASAAEVQVNALNAYNAGVIRRDTFATITAAYGSLVDTCATLPVTDSAADIAIEKITTLLTTMRVTLVANTATPSM